jgi:hypothetical protein
MPKPRPRRRVTKREIGELQAALLRSLLTGAPLPGGTAAARLPDEAFILREPDVYVEEANVVGRLAVGAPSRSVRVLSREGIRARTGPGEGPAYLSFETPEIEGTQVTLTVRARIASPTGGRDPVLSTVQVTFRRVGDAWETFGAPVYSAS